MQFGPEFGAALADLLAWRRDVRHFLRDPIPEPVVLRLIELASLAPSVGYSQPWRFVLVEDPARRTQIRTSFEEANRRALGNYSGDRAALYASLKLAGLDDAPVHLAVFADPATPTGHGLGSQTMPEMIEYSAVMAVHTLWLAARAGNIGVGWVSILDPEGVSRALDVPASWKLIAYLCLGYAAGNHDTPDLERAGWESRQPMSTLLLRR
jgi:5,6-dimethylbenzimidazole synthase